MSVILAMNSGIGSSVGIFQDGLPVFCIEEERFNRTKNWMGIPEQATQYILDNQIVKPSELSAIALVNEYYAHISRERFYGAYNTFFEQAVAEKITPLQQFSQSFLTQFKSKFNRKPKITSAASITDEEFLEKLGFARKLIKRVNHHYCHAAAAYYGLAKNWEDEYLIFTLDGGGDRQRNTVYRGHQGQLKILTSSPDYSVGNMYSAVTYFLGFTPHEHEYKLMGLAPYAQEKHFQKYQNFFEQFIDLKNEDTQFVARNPLEHEIFMRHLYHDLKKARFDNVAAGLQAFTENRVIRWIKGCIKKYKIHKILCSGGVFMNVKLNQLIAQLPEVEWLNVFPSCGDESNIFGAAFNEHVKTQFQEKLGFLNTYTLGTSPSNDLAIALNKYQEAVSVQQLDNPNKYICEQLLQGQIVARCSGKMEFGARALGNRSILAHPENLVTVGKINRAIKNRDFWMPFAPAVLWEHAEKILKIPNSLKPHGSPYMMFAFDTLPDYREKIMCVLHQADFTARAQTVTQEQSPDLYEIIDRFYQKTKIPVILNTSFNLHGYPIVENSEQAINVLLHSELDVLVIDNVAIHKNRG